MSTASCIAVPVPSCDPGQHDPRRTALLLLADDEAVTRATRCVAGLPPWLRTVCLLQDVGITRILILAPGGGAARLALGDRRVRAEVVTASTGRLAAATGPVLMLRGDLVYRRDALAWLLTRASGNALVAQAPAVGVTAALAPAEAYLPWCATEAGAAGDIARSLPDAATVSFPVDLVSPVGTAEERRRAERMLLDSLHKSTDGFLSRVVNRRVSRLVTRVVMHTPVHPNYITLAALVVGVASGLVTMRGGYLAAVVGALLFEAQSILDGVDGEVARLKHLRSRTGEWLDMLADDVSNAAFIAGIACNLTQAGAAWAIIVGTVTVGSHVVGRLLVYWLLASVYRRGDQFAIRWTFTPTEGVSGVARLGARIMVVLRIMIKRDFFATLFLVLALLGRTDAILGLALIGAVGFLLKVVPETGRARRAGTGTLPQLSEINE